MVSLNPFHEFVLHLRYCLESGQSMREAVRKFQVSHPEPKDPVLALWLKNLDVQKLAIGSLRQRAILALCERGLRGEPILSMLIDVERELQMKVTQDLEKFAARVPLQLTLVLVFFMFPAFLLLLLGPLLDRLAQF